jgi:hypothetical protein
MGKALHSSSTGLFVLLLGLLAGPTLWAQQTWEVDISGDEYNPKELTASVGDTIHFCNQGTWRRQPYSSNEYNRFGNRNAETYEMLKKGECKGIKIQNPTKTILNFTVRDAVAPKAKLKVSVQPGKPR